MSRNVHTAGQLGSVDTPKRGGANVVARQPAVDGVTTARSYPARICAVPGLGAPEPATGENRAISRAEAAYVELRLRILRLQFAPGASFTEAELALALRSTRTPVREALARLRREGLVESAPRAGYRVAPLTVKDARDLFGLRTLLEGESAAIAAREGGDLVRLRELDACCQALLDADRPSDIAHFLARNAAFHVAVAQLGGNARLTEALRRVIEQLERYMHLGLALNFRAREIVHEHQDLLAAIMAGDVDQARRVAVQQARASHRMVLDGLLSSDAVQSANIGGPVGSRRCR
ncbi:MAG: GntR family transcriptional regulator [Mycobacteriales bacterium]